MTVATQQVTFVPSTNIRWAGLQQAETFYMGECQNCITSSMGRDYYFDGMWSSNGSNEYMVQIPHNDESHCISVFLTLVGREVVVTSMHTTNRVHCLPINFPEMVLKEIRKDG